MKKKHSVGTILAGGVLLVTLLCISADSEEWLDDPEWWSPPYEESCSVLAKALHQELTKMDGIAVHYVADCQFWAMLLHPNAFYEELSSDSIYFQRFIESLHFVFWNFNDTTTAHLERLRQVAIWRLVDITYTIEKKHLVRHEEMIGALRHVEVGYVD